MLLDVVTIGTTVVTLDILRVVVMILIVDLVVTSSGGCDGMEMLVGINIASSSYQSLFHTHHPNFNHNVMFVVPCICKALIRVDL